MDMEKPTVKNAEGIKKLSGARSIASGLGVRFQFGFEVEAIKNTPEVNSKIDELLNTLKDLEGAREACQLKIDELSNSIFNKRET